MIGLIIKGQKNFVLLLRKTMELLPVLLLWLQSRRSLSEQRAPVRRATEELTERRSSLPFLAKGLDRPLACFLVRPLPFQNKLVILKRFNNKILNTKNILQRTKEEVITAKTGSIYMMPGCHLDSSGGNSNSSNYSRCLLE